MASVSETDATSNRSVVKEYFGGMGASAIATMAVVGPASVATMLQAGAILGPGYGWIALFSGFTMWVILATISKTTCVTGDASLTMLGKLWKPLVLVGGLLWFVPEIFIVLVMGVSTSQTAAAITGVSSQLVVWPVLLLVALVFYSGAFSWLKVVASLLLSILLIIGLIFAARVLVGGELPAGEALLGSIVPRWPASSQAPALFAAAIGGAGSFAVILYQGYAIIDANNNRPSRLKISYLDSFVFGFLVLGLFSWGMYLASASVFYPGNAPDTAPAAAELFVPLLGQWSYVIFYAGFLGALITTLAATNIILVTSVFAVAHYYLDTPGWRPVMENGRFRLTLWASLFIVAGVGSLLGQETILPLLVWSLGLVAFVSAPGYALWFYFTNSSRWVGENRNSWYLNVALLVLIATALFLAVRNAPQVFTNPFSG